MPVSDLIQNRGARKKSEKFAQKTLLNLRLNFAAEQACGVLPIVFAYGLRVLSAVFRGLQVEILRNP
jgi:hypothetical protein